MSFALIEKLDILSISEQFGTSKLFMRLHSQHNDIYKIEDMTSGAMSGATLSQVTGYSQISSFITRLHNRDRFIEI